jgi:hypothetical protein
LAGEQLPCQRADSAASYGDPSYEGPARQQVQKPPHRARRSSVKLRRGLVALALPVALLGTAQPAAAASVHTVTVKGTMALNDHEPLSHHEKPTYTFSRRVTLSHGSPSATVAFSAAWVAR